MELLGRMVAPCVFVMPVGRGWGGARGGLLLRLGARATDISRVSSKSQAVPCIGIPREVTQLTRVPAQGHGSRVKKAENWVRWCADVMGWVWWFAGCPWRNVPKQEGLSKTGGQWRGVGKKW